MPYASPPPPSRRPHQRSSSRSGRTTYNNQMKGSVVTAAPQQLHTPVSDSRRRRPPSPSIPQQNPHTPSRSTRPSHHHPAQSQYKSPPHHHATVKVQTHNRGDSFSDGGSVTSNRTFASKEGREPAKQSKQKGSSIREGSPVRSSTSSSKAPLKKQDSKHLSAKKAIDDLRKNINDGQKRTAKLTFVCAEFDHWDESKHNMELHYGAAHVLAQMLQSNKNDDDDIRMICAALEMVFRASPMAVQKAFEKVGPKVVPWLLQVLHTCETGRMKHADVSILNITKIMTYFSRIPELRVPLANHVGMLDALCRVCTSIMNVECRVARMRLLSNLANCDDNKELMCQKKGLMEAIMRIAALDLSEVARECASTALMDLAACPANQVPMANNDKVLGTLVKLAVVETVSETREAAITALQNLAYCQQNRVRLVSYSSGVVVEALKKAISTDPNDKARRRAAGALTNLACGGSAEKMGNHKGLLESLAVVSSRDDNAEVQSRATMALTKIAASITCDMACYRTLLDALVVASLSNHGNAMCTVLRVKAREPENRASMARHPGILDTLADVCVSSSLPAKVRDNAMRAIMHLTNEDSNRIIMCNKTMLDALVAGSSIEDDSLDDIRESAIVALERLATDASNRPIMARHNGLLTAVAKATEREAKMQDSGRTSNREFLAKPLLMSLLLAM